MNSTTREGALRKVVNLTKPLREAIAALEAFGWDSDTELVTLTKSHIAGVLASYLDGAVTSEEVQQWAEALEGRDDLGLEVGSEDLLKEALFELSTPELAEPLTINSAQGWLQKLGAR